MAWDGSGTFTRSNGTQTGATTWADADAAGNNITTSQHDTHDEDLADGIQACLTKNNESKPTASFQPNADNSLALGSTTLKWSDLFLGSGGVINWDNGDVTITHAANTLAFAGGSYTFAGAVTPAASDGSALGTSALMWSDLFLASGGVINFNAGNYTLTHSAGTLTLSGALTVQGAFTSLGIDDNATAEVLQLGDTEIVVGQSGANYTIRRNINTHQLIISGTSGSNGGRLVLNGAAHADANDIALSNGSNVVLWDDSASTLNVLGTLSVATNAVPDANDGAGLGTSALGWSDLFLASGALINVANGNAVITHSSGIFTVSTGDFRVTTAGTNAASAVTVGGTQTLTNKTISTGCNVIALGTEQATTSGTSIDFTSIPAGVKRVTVMFVGVSTNGSSVPIIQLGDSGGVEDAEYTASATFLDNTPAITHVTSTAGFPVVGSNGAGNVLNGAVTFTREDAANNTWVCSGTISSSGSMNLCAGSKSLSGTLDSLRLTTAGGVNTFDAGAVNINYEF